MYQREEIKRALSELIAQAMYMDEAEIGPDQLFSDFGLESVTLVKIIQKLCVRFPCEFNLSSLLLHQTLDDASTYIHERLTAQSQEQDHAKEVL